MKLKSDYNVLLKGRPEGRVEVLPVPEVLYVPLHSRRFSFEKICVDDCRQVSAGDTKIHPGLVMLSVYLLGAIIR